MTEKKGKDKKHFWKQFIEGEILTLLVSNIKSLVTSTLDNVQKSIKDTIEFIIKKAFSFILMIIGVIFLLVGISRYIEIAFNLANGVGYILVGITIVLIGVIINLMSKR